MGEKMWTRKILTPFVSSSRKTKFFVWGGHRHLSFFKERFYKKLNYFV